MIKLKNVKKRYKHRVILDDVNLKIKSPGIYLVIGNNGSGKSTLLNILGGFINSKGRIDNPYKNNMGCLFQKHYLIEYLTIEENLKIFNIDVEVLKKYGLLDKKDNYPNQLSSGQLQKMVFIITMYANNQLVLLDEPFNNLDKQSCKIIQKEIINQRKDKIIIIVTHQIENLYKHVQGYIKIEEGKLIFVGKNSSESLSIEKTKKRKITKLILKKESEFFKKNTLKRYTLFFIGILLIVITSLTKVIIKDLYNDDLENCLDINKVYLKECQYIEKNGFIISKCSNPNEQILDDLKNNNIEYGLNYDYILNHLYSRNDLFVISNQDGALLNGEYPKKVNQVITSNKYNIGDKIILNSELIIKGKNIDIYVSEIELEVVGIYNDLHFFKQDDIYFDYYLMENYLKNERFKNNKLSLFDYYNNLEIDNYKYLSFDESNYELDGDNIKKQFYKEMEDLIVNVEDLLKYIEMFVFVYCLYVFYKINKEKLIDKQKGVVFLLTNSYSKYQIINIEILKEVIYLVFVSSLIVLTTSFIRFEFFIIAKIFNFIALITFISYLQSLHFYSRKKLAGLMREEI